MAFGKHPAVVDSGSYGTLMCKCGGDYLHQGNVTMFVRDEDELTTTVIAQSDKTVQISNFPSDDTCNPSPRRHGLIIEFWCELCNNGQDPEVEGGKPVEMYRLAIFQHKGQTYMEWV